MKKILYLFFLTAVFVACQDSSVLNVEDLKCEMLEAPLAIDNTSPHFSWKMRSKQNGATATAYQILVATTLDKLNEEEADLWNTGKVADAASVGIAYGGSRLLPVRWLTGKCVYGIRTMRLLIGVSRHRLVSVS